MHNDARPGTGSPVLAHCWVPDIPAARMHAMTRPGGRACAQPATMSSGRRLGLWPAPAGTVRARVGNLNLAGNRPAAQGPLAQARPRVSERARLSRRVSDSEHAQIYATISGRSMAQVNLQDREASWPIDRAFHCTASHLPRSLLLKGSAWGRIDITVSR